MISSTVYRDVDNALTAAADYLCLILHSRQHAARMNGDEYDDTCIEQSLETLLANPDRREQLVDMWRTYAATSTDDRGVA